MSDIFLEYIEKRAPLEPAEKDFLLSQMELRRFKKGEYLLEEGQISDTFYFNIEGCIRLFYNIEGEERTAYFYTEGQFISAYDSFINKIPAQQNFQAIEDSLTIAIDVQLAAKLLSYSSKFEMLARIAMEEELIACQSIIASFITKSPEERYLQLMKSRRDYFQRIPQHYIASFLGVKPESLSRIKKRVIERKS